MPKPCRHEDTEELQDHKEFLKLTRWKRSSHQRLVVIDEARQNRALNLRGDMDSCTAGVDRATWVGEAVEVPKGVMPTQVGRGVRSCSIKLARAEFYSTRWRQGSGRDNHADPIELERALKELGL